MLQFIRAPNFWYVYVRRYQHICRLMADSLRELRTAVREWECWISMVKKKLSEYIRYKCGNLQNITPSSNLSSCTEIKFNP